ncbi:MAG: GFA family protein [Granulosicoccus sp.]
MKASFAFEGGCSCRSLRYQMTAEPLIVHACHCRQCQRVTGSAFVLNALVEKTNVKLLCGDLKNIHFSDTYHTAYYCGRCATYVWSEYKSGRFDNCWFMRVGTLDEPDRSPPDVHIYVESKQPWVVIPDETLRFERFYKIRDVWNSRSIERMGPSWNPPVREQGSSHTHADYMRRIRSSPPLGSVLDHQ